MKVLAKIFAISFAILVFSTLVIQAQESSSASKNTATPDSESKPITKKYIQTSKSAARVSTFGSSKSVRTRATGAYISITSGIIGKKIKNLSNTRVTHDNSAQNVTVEKRSQEQATDKPTSVTETK